MTDTNEDGQESEQGTEDVAEAATLVPESTPKVLGEIGDTDATGVVGRTTASTSVTYGVYGETQSTSGDAAGVKGVASAATGEVYGVHGVTNSNLPGAASIFADATSADSIALIADSTGSQGDGVYGIADRAGYWGVWGEHEATSGKSTHGVYAGTASVDAAALYASGSGGGAIETNGDVTVVGDLDVTGTLPSSTGGAEVSLSSNQSISSSNYTKVPFDNVITEQRSEFNTSTGVFTCAEDGNYHVDASVAWEDLPADTSHTVEVRVNGTEVANEHRQSGSSGFQSISKSKTLLDLSVNDEIDVRIWQSSGSSQEIVGSLNEPRVYTTLTVSQIG